VKINAHSIANKAAQPGKG